MNISQRTLESASGTRYEIDHCWKALDKLERGSPAHKHIEKVLGWILNRMRLEQKLEKEEVFTI